MSTVAVILDHPGWSRRVAGLRLYERAVLALHQAGVDRVAVVVAADAAPAWRRELGRGRLAAAQPDVLEGTGDRAWDQATAYVAGQSALVFYTPAAIDPRFVEGLLELQAAGIESPTLAHDVVLLAPAGVSPRSTVDVAPLAAPLAGVGQPVGSDRDGRRARHALLAQSIKPLEIDGIICFLLIRRLSVRISAVLLSLPVSPNLVTAGSLLLGLGAAWLVGVGTHPWPIWGGALLMLSLILDNCDGEIARVKFQGSRAGAWFDIYADFVVNAAFLAGMAVGAWRTFDQPVYLAAGAFAVAAISFYNGTVFRYIHRLGIPDEFLFKWWFDQEREAQQGEPVREEPGAAGPSVVGRFLSGLKYLGRRDFFIFAYLVTAALGVLHWAFWVTVVGAAMNFVMTCYQVFLWKGLPPGRRTDTADGP